MKFPRILAAALWVASVPARADVALDGTLGPKGRVEAHDAQGHLIVDEKDGSRRGGNLFHSFFEFNIGPEQSVEFTGSQEIRNVISRITGGRSTVEGTISSGIPGANLFFLNPAGIILTRGARLDVNGTVSLSTGDYIDLGSHSGQRFYADPKQPSVLSAVDVSAFGFLRQDAATIEVKGGSEAEPLRPGGLSIVAGGITLDGRRVETPDGAIDLVSIGSTGRVLRSMNGSQQVLNADEVGRLGSLRLSGTTLDVRGDRSGKITLLADEIEIDRSLLAAGTRLNGTGGGIQIGARSSLMLRAGSHLNADMDGSGEGPRIDLHAGRTLIIEDGQVAADAINAHGAGGGIALTSHTLRVRDSEIRSAARGAAQAGNVSIQTDGDVQIQDSFVGSRTESASAVALEPDGAERFGSIGSVSVSARDLSVSGDSQLGTMIDANGGGHADVDLTVRRLQVLDGAEVGIMFPQFFDFNLSRPASTDFTGSVHIMARDSVDIRGYRNRPDGYISQSSIENQNVNGRDDPAHERLLVLKTRSLRVANTGFLGSGTLGSGNAADVVVTVRDLQVLEGAEIDTVAGDGNIGNAVPPISGNGGSLEIHATGRVDVSGFQPQFRSRSAIDSGTRGSGNGGEISIQAAKLVVDGGDIRSATAVNPGSGENGGDAGDVVIHVGRLEVRNGGLVRSSASTYLTPGEDPSTGNGADLSVTAGSVLLEGTGLEPFRGQQVASQLSARTATAGSGGTVSIRAGDLEVRDGAVILADTAGAGKAGDVHLDVKRIDIENGSGIRTSAARSDGGNIVIGSGRQLVLSGGGTITTEGQGSGGNIDIASDVTVLENGRINASAVGGNGGRVHVRSQFLIGDPNRIQAKSERGLPGTITMPPAELSVIREIAELPSRFLEAERLLRPECALRDPESGGSLVVAERNGIAALPEGWLLAFDEEGASEPLAPVATPAKDDWVAATRLAELRGAKALQAGDLSAAAREFSAAGASPDDRIQARGLRGEAQVEQERGAFRSSIRSLLEALLAAERSGDGEQIALALGSLGNAYVALEQPELARDHLSRAVAVARATGSDSVTAQLLINQGNYQAMSGEFAAARDSYREAAALAEKSARPLYAVEAWANEARLLLKSPGGAEADVSLERARTQAEGLSATQDKVFSLIHIAQSELLMLARSPGESEASRMRNAHRDLMEAATIATEIGAQRALSYAFGSLGALYERGLRYEEALEATHRAVLAAEQVGAAEALYRMHAQSARILTELSRLDDALDEHRRAVAIVERLQPESAFSYARAELTFRDHVAPVYRALVDLLLKKAALADEANAQSLLLEARSTEESMRAAELRDYFRDDCAAALAAREQKLDDVAPDAAIIYPVLLPDRIELLVSRGRQLRRYSVSESIQSVSEQARRLRRALEHPGNGESYHESAEQLYQWLVAPYIADLERSGIKTLVFVPDGALRTIPFAALHDGHDFLVRRFSVAITPGLSLTDPHPLERSDLKILVAGLSERVQGFPELPYVSEEVEAIRGLYGATLLLNQEFTEKRTEDALTSQDFSVVHVASHSVFSSSAGESFVLTHDGRISMQQLTEWVSRTRFRDRPLELLVLSACATAAGDERSALGLAGVAIRSGARSAVGSLWNIDDEAASRLIIEFYRQLRSPGVSRAQALQRAQLALLDSDRFHDPGFWSAFLLINSWL